MEFHTVQNPFRINQFCDQFYDWPQGACNNLKIKKSHLIAYLDHLFQISCSLPVLRSTDE